MTSLASQCAVIGRLIHTDINKTTNADMIAKTVAITQAYLVANEMNGVLGHNSAL